MSMNTKFIVLIACLATASIAQETFEQWAAQCSWSYADDAEKEYRRGVFEANKAEIDAINSQNLSYKAAINCPFGDRTVEEKSAISTGGVGAVRLGLRNSVSAVDPTAVPPDSVDWRDEGMITAVKNQEQCGSCWAFATTAAYEAFSKIAGLGDQDLSEEYVLECTTPYASASGRVSSCGGGYVNDAAQMVVDFGMPLETTFPYISGAYGTGVGSQTTPNICDRTDTSAWIKENLNGAYYPYYDLDDATMKLHVAYAPVVALIYADNTGFSSYSSGVYSGCPDYATSKAAINHAVIVVGYDIDGNWIIKNSWSTSWGQNGYGVISATADCGVKAYVYEINGDNAILTASEPFTKIFLAAFLFLLAFML